MLIEGLPLIIIAKQRGRAIGMSDIDPFKILILLEIKGTVLDKTDQVVALPIQNSLGQYVVEFKQGTKRVFPFSAEKVTLSKAGYIVPWLGLLCRGEEHREFKTIVLFPDIGWVKCFYRNDKSVVFGPGSWTKIVPAIAQGSESERILNYYLRIVQIVDTKTAPKEEESDAKKAPANNPEDPEEERPGFLEQQLLNLKEVDSNRFLSCYLEGRSFEIPCKPPLIFPFDFNKSQRQAVGRSFTNSVSIIEGPPGTGKTQTILNIAANAIVQNQTVAVCSNNNAALENVRDKLLEEGYGYLCAFLGKNDNLKKFFSESHPWPKVARKPNPGVSQEKYQEALQAQLLVCEARNDYEALAEEFSRIEKEFLVYQKQEGEKLKRYDEKRPFSLFCHQANPKHLLYLSTLIANNNRDRFGLFGFLHFHFALHVPWRLLFQGPMALVSFFTYRYYQNKIRIAQEELGQKKAYLADLEEKAKGTSIQDYSDWVFTGALARRYGEADDSAFDLTNYKIKFTPLLHRFPIILSSTYALAKCTPREYAYDLLIIDEASQVNMASALIAFSKAKRVVVVGDLQQLPEIDDEDLKKTEGVLRANFKVPDPYRYFGNNILLSLKDLYGEQLSHTLLEEHYRCQEDIIAFSNKRFYGNRLICLSKKDDYPSHLKIIHTIFGHHARGDESIGGLYNDREIEQVIKEVQEQHYDPNDKKRTLAIITPYRAQANRLQTALPGFPVDTIHKFQGRECDDVIFSTVANDAEDYMRNEEKVASFINNREMLNVAMTRAKHHFTLVTSDEIYHHAKGFLGDLIRYMTYETGGDVSEGKIKSIFDVFYSDRQVAQLKVLHQTNTDEALSEILFAQLLDEVLKNKKYASFSYSMHVNLKALISIDPKRYSDEEYRYLTHSWTHIDFALFNIYDKKPLIFFEVDGVAYHEQKAKQQLHDKWKDQAVRDAGLPLLRFKTNESEERTRIIAALDHLC